MADAAAVHDTTRERRRCKGVCSANAVLVGKPVLRKYAAPPRDTCGGSSPSGWITTINAARTRVSVQVLPDSADDHVSAGDRDTEDAHTGDDFPIKNVLLYTNASRSRNQPPSDPGLPVFLYIEVDFFEDDRQIDC